MDKVQELHRRQEERERDQIQSGRDRFLSRLNRAKQGGRGSDEGALMVWLAQNTETLIEAFQSQVDGNVTGRKPAIYEFVEDLGSEIVGAVALMVVANHALKGSPKDTIGREIVTRLIAERRAKLLRRDAPGLFAYKEQSFKGTTDFWFRAKSLWASLKWSDVDSDHLEFAAIYQTRLSSQILHICQATLGSVVKEEIRWRGRKSTAYWTFTPEFAAEITAKDAEFALLARPMYRPTLVPPRNWSDEDRGGYWYGLRGDVSLIRRGKKWQYDTIEGREMHTLYTALNTVQATPWKINQRVLEVANHLKARGGDVAGLPALEQADHPKWPSVVPFESRGKAAKLNNEERLAIDNADNADEIRTALAQYKKAQGAWHDAEIERASVASAFLNQLDVAWDNEAEDRFWFPHNLDWRGRVYPVSEYLHPQGDDVARGLLQFAEGKPLGPDGAYWLAVKGATSWDGDEKLSKQSFDDRVKWVENNGHQIAAIAMDPYANSSWMDADAPFQFLAFCFEWVGAEAEGEAFVSHLPIPQDGSSNAYQHYAALWRDAEGAEFVNLTQRETPNDLYQLVADATLDRMARLHARGNDTAGLWLGKIDRKLAKIPTMTAVYGSRVQMWPRTIDRALKSRLTVAEYNEYKAPFGEDWWDARVLLANEMSKAMNEIVPAAMHGRNYLRALAKALSKEGKGVEWTTPLTGFPVRQRTMKTRLRQVTSYLSGVRTYNQSFMESTDRMDKMAQQDGLAANFIHSHDAAHLMGTVASMADNHGIEDVMVVHDSFAVHACNVPAMRRVLAEQFVELHQTPIIENLTATAEAAIEDSAELPEPLPVGAFDLGVVYTASYLFS